MTAHKGGWPKGRTHCLRNHPLTPENTWRHKNGSLECKACRAIRDRETGNGWVPAAPTIQRVRALIESGMSIRSICHVSGLAYRQILDLKQGKRTRVQARTARTVQAVNPNRAPQYVTSTVGATRRVRALVACGWSIRQIERRSALCNRTIHLIVHAENPTVSVETAYRIRRLYDRLWDQRPPDDAAATAARNRAARAGWAPPLAWDDDQLDDPNAEPAVFADAAEPTQIGMRPGRPRSSDLDELMVEAFLDGHHVPLSHADGMEVIRRLLMRGRMSHTEIAERVGTTARTVARISAELQQQEAAA